MNKPTLILALKKFLSSLKIILSNDYETFIDDTIDDNTFDKAFKELNTTLNQHNGHNVRNDIDIIQNAFKSLRNYTESLVYDIDVKLVGFTCKDEIPDEASYIENPYDGFDHKYETNKQYYSECYDYLENYWYEIYLPIRDTYMRFEITGQ